MEIKESKETVAFITKDVGSITGKLEAKASWVDGKFKSIQISMGVFNVINMGDGHVHAFYELVDELKTLTNNPPVGCEPV